MGVKLEPLGDRIVVEELPDPEVSAGGVVLPEQSRERPQRGLVVAVGPGKAMLDGLVVAVPLGEGDVVLFSRYAGTEVPGDPVPLRRGAKRLILREADVLAREVQVPDPPEERGVGKVSYDGEYPARTGAREALTAEGYTDANRVPPGMVPMPRTGVATPYERITFAEAVARGYDEPGRRQELREHADGVAHVYDFDSCTYWPLPEDPPEDRRRGEPESLEG